MLTFGSLFAGIGGFDLGFERAGLACCWQVEIDDFCTAVLEKHWPEVKRFRDVRECGKHNLKAVDVICGGFPCQPHSQAGRQRGAKDDRDLWPEFARIIAECRPSWVVAENVPGIRTTILDQVLSDLEGMGYATGQAVIPACGVDSPQRRRRIWVVANAEENPIRPGLRQDETGTEWGRRFTNGGSKIGDWPPEPGVGRVAYGVSGRMDRLRGLGNAVVPQVAEFIGELIIQVENAVFEEVVAQAVRKIYGRDRYWEHPLFHEAMDSKEIIHMANVMGEVGDENG